MSARGYALHSVCHQLSFLFLHSPTDLRFDSPGRQTWYVLKWFGTSKVVRYKVVRDVENGTSEGTVCMGYVVTRFHCTTKSHYSQTCL